MELVKQSESEKLTLNIGYVDLGKIDLLVREGFYSNRSDFIRTAIRNQLDRHTLEIQQSVTRHSYVIGVLAYDKADLEKVRLKGEKLELNVVGFLHLANNITPDDDIAALRVDIAPPLLLATMVGVPASAGGEGSDRELSDMIIVPDLGDLQLQTK